MATGHLQRIVRRLRPVPGRQSRSEAAPRPDYASPIDTTPRWGGPGVHGIARRRRWDAVVVAETPGPAGIETVRFVALPSGAALAEEGGRLTPAPGLAPLVAAMNGELAPPYRAEAVRRDGELWAVAANRIEVSVLPPETPGDHIVFSVQAGERLLRVDDLPAFQALPAIEELGARCGAAYVVQASRLAGDLWEVQVEPL
jgi:hypothetical protein